MGLGIPREPVKHYFWVCLCGCFQRRLVGEWEDILQVGGTIQSAGAQTEQERQRISNFLSLLELGSCPLASELQGLWPLDVGTYTSIPQGSQAFGFGLSHAPASQGLWGAGLLGDSASVNTQASSPINPLVYLYIL